MIYEQNLEKMQKFQTGLYNRICETDFSWDVDRIEIEYARNEEPVVVYIQNDGTRVYLNSRYNPSKEAEKFMGDFVDLPEKATLVMIGFGNGAHIREFISKSQKDGTNCIVYEPCKDLFMKILHEVDVTDILGDSRVHIIVKDINDKYTEIFLEIYISNVNEKTNKHISLPKYRQVFPEDCNSFLEVLKNRYDDIAIEKNTIHKYGERVAYNTIHNMCFLPGCRSGVEYMNKFPKDLPGIVVAAGPSLEKNVELLKKAKGHALIIVVDTAIKIVMSHGIIPDMVISIDNHKPVHLFDVKGLEKIPFLAEMAANTEVLEFLKSEQLIFYSADSIVWDKLFREAGSEIRQIYAGGTVAIDAMANLIEWGFKRIIMVGQDLMLTGNKFHAGEEKIEDLSAFRGCRIIKIKDIYGNDGYTYPDFYIYIREIEKLAGRFDVQFIDATEGGAFINNTDIMTLEEAINEYCTNEYDIDGIIQNNERIFVGDKKDLPYRKMHEMKEHLIDMKLSLEQGVDACEQGWTLLENKQYDVEKLKNINAILEDVDSKYENFDESVCVLKCASDGYYEFEDEFYLIEDDHIKESIRMYKKSAAYYQSIADAIPKIIEMVDGAMKCWDSMYDEK